MMTTPTTPLANEIREEILRITAGEESRKETPTLLSENRFIEGSELKLMLSFMTEELKDEFRILREDVNYLRHYMRDNHVEYIKLREDMKEMKTELRHIRKHVLSHTQIVTNAEVADTKDTTFHIENHLINDFSLPLFNENTANPVFHLKQLDNCMELKRILNDRKLILAYKSMNSEMSTQWVETVINHIGDYETFKKEFLNTWWSTSQQSLIKCSIYQDKYDKRSNMSLSAHFL
jgi:hypothetical protein